MTDEDIKVGIAGTVCARFIDGRTTTSRRMLLTEFESPDLLDQMVHRCLIRASNARDNYLPTVGTFALLGDHHELYQQARSAFEQVARGLYSLYRSEGDEFDNSLWEFVAFINSRFHNPIPPVSVNLGLHLASEFSLIQSMGMDDDLTTIESFRISERAITMSDPMPFWEQRVRASRESIRTCGVRSDLTQLVTGARLEYDPAQEPFDECGFWSMIHPDVKVKARPRFEAGHYSDAVDWALKVVAEEVRSRTGLTTDGAGLMRTAFSVNNPLLQFSDPIPDTRKAIQQGFMEIYAGTMMGVRNPKAHGMVILDKGRCIHFLFLASLLRFKLDDATRESPEPIS